MQGNKSNYGELSCGNHMKYNGYKQSTCTIETMSISLARIPRAQIQGATWYALHLLMFILLTTLWDHFIMLFIISLILATLYLGPNIFHTLTNN